MAIGQRIKFFRNLRNLTQKELGQKIGFQDKAADVRIAQYESEKRTPKEDLVNALAHYLDVSPVALNVPDIDSYIGLMHTLFALEDTYGFKINKLDDEVCITLDPKSPMYDRLNSWQKEYQKLTNNEITQEEYDHWRYTYPKVESERTKQSLDKKKKSE